MAPTLTTYQKLNREKLVRYFEDGCKKKKTLGFELEHILLHKNDDAAYPVIMGIISA